MDPSELLAETVGLLEALGIDYLVTGSMASIAYGEPRFTNDIDIVVRMGDDQAVRLCQELLNREFYVDEATARDAVRHARQFNAIHPSSGLKIDFMAAPDDDFNRSRFARARRLPTSHDARASFAAPEDVIIKKLEYYREGGSDKHLRDIRGILKIAKDAIDHAYLVAWIDKLGLGSEWAAASRADS